jgi:hypothetical protein
MSELYNEVISELKNEESFNVWLRQKKINSRMSGKKNCPSIIDIIDLRRLRKFYKINEYPKQLHRYYIYEENTPSWWRIDDNDRYYNVSFYNKRFKISSRVANSDYTSWKFCSDSDEED